MQNPCKNCILIPVCVNRHWAPTIHLCQNIRAYLRYRCNEAVKWSHDGARHCTITIDEIGHKFILTQKDNGDVLIQKGVGGNYDGHAYL